MSKSLTMHAAGLHASQLTLLHSGWPNRHRVLAFLSAIGLNHDILHFFSQISVKGNIYKV